jgi:ribonuclease E
LAAVEATDSAASPSTSAEETFTAPAESQAAVETRERPTEEVTAPAAVDEAPAPQPADAGTERAAGSDATAETAAAPDADSGKAKQKAAEQPTGFSGGRASNDPRIAPKPVESVVVDTAHPILFRDVISPPVVPVRPRPPRASNDPRGPAVQQAVGESAEASAESQSANL